MAGIKIVDLPALGRDLISTDLLELSLAGGTGSRKITGQEIMNASKLSVGNTPIINGAVGQVLFQGTGNVLGESANLFWDNTNVRLGVGTSSPSERFVIDGDGVNITGQTNLLFNSRATSASGYSSIIFKNTNTATTIAEIKATVGAGYTNNTLGFFSQGTERMRIFGATGNVGIGTTTDAGYKLDVNGSFRSTDGLIASSVGGYKLTVQQTGAGQGPTFRVIQLGYSMIDVDTNSVSFMPFPSPSGTVGITNWTSLGGSGLTFFTKNSEFTPQGGPQAIPLIKFPNPSAPIVMGATATADLRAYLTVSGSFNATSGLGAGQSLLPSLTATANNDVLVGLDISPTFTNGAFTGVTQFFGRFANSNGGTSLPATTGTTQTGGILRLGRDNAVLDIGSHSAGGAWFQSVNRNSLSTNYNIFLNPNGGNILIGTTTDAGYKLDVNGDTILRRVTFITPNTITGGTEFFRVKSGNWPTSLIQGYENGVLNLGSSSGSIGFNTANFSLPVGSFFSFNYVPANILNTYAFLLTANYTNVGAGGTSEGAMLRTTGSTATSVGNVTMNQIEMKPTYNNTGGNTINRGFYYNPTVTSLTNTTHFAIHSTSGRVRLEGLPTSPTGLNAGDIYNDGGTLRIV